jgi:hypothetical protein
MTNENFTEIAAELEKLERTAAHESWSDRRLLEKVDRILSENGVLDAGRIALALGDLTQTLYDDRISLIQEHLVGLR